MTVIRRLVLIGAAAGLAAAAPCAQAEPRADAVAAVLALPPGIAPLPKNFTPGEPAPNWWAVYRDPALDALIGRLHASSPSLAAAKARLDRARAEARVEAAARLPSLVLDGSASRTTGPLVNQAGQSGDLYAMRAAASWELDLAGRLSAERRAGRASVAAEEAELADATLLLEGETARLWFSGQTYALAASEAEGAAAVLEERLAIARARLERGLVTGAAVDPLRQGLADARARARDLALSRDRAGRQLGALVGSAEPVAFPQAEDIALPPPVEVPAGLPADILARRPDVRAAAGRVTAADARLSAIRRGWLPPITLTAAQGQAASGLGQLFATASGLFGLSALLNLPIFNGGRHRARVAGGGAERDLAEAQYRATVLAVLHEVNDDLQIAAARRTAWDEAHDGAAAGAALLRAARGSAANGTIGRDRLLEAELAARERQLALTLAHGQALASTITVQQALGGGW